MFKEILKRLREQKGWSQRKLAEEICFSQPLITALERGTREPTVKILIALADIFECTTDYLLGRHKD